MTTFMRQIISKVFINRKIIWLHFQKDKGRWLLFSLIGLLLTLVMVKPDTGVSLSNPWKLIVNHTTKECADLYIGFGNNEPKDCSIPEGWEEAEYEIANFVCPKGYESIGRFEGEKCLKLSQNKHNPQRRSNSGGFGCAPLPY